MTTQTYNTRQNVVKELRKIRDQVSSEIKDMTFAEERAYLDKLLADKKKSSHKNESANSSGADTVRHELP